MLGAFLVWAGLAIGLRMLSGGGAWHLGWMGSISVATLLWPAFVIGYLSLQRLGFGSARDRDDETVETAWYAAMGAPVLLMGFAWSVVVLGGLRFVDAFAGPAPKGMVNFFMSIVALHVFAWGAAGAMQWAWVARRAREE